MPDIQDDYLKKLAPQFARLGIWQARFAPAQHRLIGTSLQKITASDEGYVCLSVYKPGDDRSVIVMSIRRQDPGVLLSHNRPKPQVQPNSFIQVARKHIVGRRISFVHCSIEPTCFFIEFEPGRLTPDDEERPDMLILDLESKPARLIIARKHPTPPDRYQNATTSGTQQEPWPPNQTFYESFCEWSLDATKTKKRVAFDRPLVGYCWMPAIAPARPIPTATQPKWGILTPTEPRSAAPTIEKVEETGLEGDSRHEFGFAEKKAFEQGEMTLAKALALLPVHIRRAAKVRMQFLERRLLRQRTDLPLESEILRLARRAEGLRSHLYLWPENSNTWYVPADIIDATGLPSFLQHGSGQRPSDLLEEEFRQVDRLKRRRSELLQRMEDSRSAVDSFVNQVIKAGSSIWHEIAGLAPEGQFGLAELGVYFSRIRPAAAETLCRELSVTWDGPGQKPGKDSHPSQKTLRLPYRVYRATTGEFIHVARSAAESDLMLKLMPSHHIWLHVLSGEGSHVWLEKPKKAEPSSQALREAAMLAIHNSRLARGRQGEVRVATRTDVEKKKNLPPGKVLVRRCRTILVKYDAVEIDAVLKGEPPRVNDTQDSPRRHSKSQGNNS